MKIKLYPPLDRMFGPERELQMDRPVSVGEVLRSLTDEVPDFARYAGFRTGDVQPYGLLVWRNHKVLKLSDTVQPDDEVEMRLMVSGG